MSFKEVNILRKDGKLDGAYAMAKADMENAPDDIWAKRAMGWVLYEYIKKYPLYKEREKFNTYLDEFISLEIGNKDKDELFYKNIKFRIIKFIFDLVSQKNLNTSALNDFFNRIKKLQYLKPSELHSKILQAVLKISDKWSRFFEFIEWWNLENFRKEDTQKQSFTDGEKIMALKEQTYLCISKYLLKYTSKDKDEKINEFIPELEKIAESNPEYIYPPYYLGKLFLALGDKADAMNKFLPFARKKKNDFWVWDLMSEVFSENKEYQLACLCKALICKSPEEMVVNVRQKLAGLLIEQKMYSETKTEIEKLVNAREQKEWKIPNIVYTWMKQNWYDKSISLKSNSEFYKKHIITAENLLYEDYESYIGVVEFVNTHKKILYFVVDKKITGNYKYGATNLTPKPGDFLEIKIEKRKSKEGEYYQAVTVCETTKTNQDLLKNVEGKPKHNHDKFIAFIEDAIVLPDLYKKVDWLDISKAKGHAVINYNKIRKEWGWKVISIDV